MRQAKRAAAEGSPAVAKRATRGECMDVIRCVARLARAHPGETYWVHGVSISCSGKRRAAKPNVHKVPEMKKGEEQKKPTKPVAPELPPTTDDDASPPAKPRKKKGAAALPKQVDVPEQEQPAMQVDVASTALLNNRQQRSARRLLAFQELKRAALSSNSSKLAAQRWAWRKSCSSTRRGGSGSRRRARGCVMSSGVPGTPSTDRSGVV